VKIPEKLLNAIGLEPMTNRDVIVAELAELTDEQFDRFLNGNVDLDQKVDALCCEACKATHNGKCPRTGDDDRCSDHYNRVDWLSQPCTHDTLITEVFNHE